MGQDFQREQMSVEEAFAEGEREALRREDPRSPLLNVYLPCVGGPQDGNLFRVPSFMLTHKQGSGDKPIIDIPASASGLQDHLPIERRVYAQYELDRSSRVLRYRGTKQLGGISS